MRIFQDVCRGASCSLRGQRVRVLLTIEGGEVVHQQLLRADEMAMSLACFTECASLAGWTVIPPAPSEDSIP